MNETFEFKTLCCQTCQVPFAVLLIHFERSRRDEEAIKCPAGHDNFYKTEKEVADEEALKAELANARREIVALKERNIEIRQLLEQAEARAIPASASVHHAPAVTAESTEVTVRRHQIGHRVSYYCPECAHEYRSSAWVRRHLVFAHGFSPLVVIRIEDGAPVGGRHGIR